MIVDVIPCDNYIISPKTRAFIVCMSYEDANRLVLLKIFIFRVKNSCSTCYPSNR
jgi:hypothetical protein